MIRKSIAAYFVLSFAFAASIVNAEDLTLEQGMHMFAFLKGEWTLDAEEGPAVTCVVDQPENTTCYVIKMKQFRGIFTYDGATKKMIGFGSHPDGVYSTGHWTQAAPNVVEGKFKVVFTDGTQEEHTGRFEVISDKEFTYAIDGKPYGTFNRK